MRWKKTALGVNVLFAATFAVIVSMSVIFLYYSYADNPYIPMVAMILSVFLPVYLLLNRNRQLYFG